MPLSVEPRLIVLHGEDSSEVWVPTQKVVEGRTFFSFTKWSASFVRVMTGKRLDLRKGKSESSGSIDVPVLAEIMQKRQSAADADVQRALEVQEEVEVATQPKKKKMKIRAGAHHVHLASPILDITVEDRTLSVLFEGIRTATIWLELKTDILEWLQERVSASQPKARKEIRVSQRGGQAPDLELDSQVSEE